MSRYEEHGDGLLLLRRQAVGRVSLELDGQADEALVLGSAREREVELALVHDALSLGSCRLSTPEVDSACGGMAQRPQRRVVGVEPVDAPRLELRVRRAPCPWRLRRAALQGCRGTLALGHRELPKNERYTFIHRQTDRPDRQTE